MNLCQIIPYGGEDRSLNMQVPIILDTTITLCGLTGQHALGIMSKSSSKNRNTYILSLVGITDGERS